MERDGRVLERNATFQRLGGPASYVHDLVVPGQASIVSELVASARPDWTSARTGALRGEEDPVDCKVWVAEHRDHVLVLIERLHAPGDRLYTLLLELNDDLLLARRELAARNRRLRELDEVKNLFFASATHDLQQPLTSLLAYAELLGEEDLGPDVARMALIIAKSARRMSVMIDDLLSAATIVTGELQLARSRTDLAALVRAAVDGIEPAARTSQVTVAYGGVESVDTFVDERRVQQVLDNLLSNAVKYSPSGGLVDVRCEVADERVTITVTDTGIGIPPEEQELVFDRYFRASTALDHGIDGTGLGLANARTFAEAHGGTLTCTSRPGAGSTFTLVLPVTAE